MPTIESLTWLNCPERPLSPREHEDTYTGPRCACQRPAEDAEKCKRCKREHCADCGDEQMHVCEICGAYRCKMCGVTPPEEADMDGWVCLDCAAKQRWVLLPPTAVVRGRAA